MSRARSRCYGARRPCRRVSSRPGRSRQKHAKRSGWSVRQRALAASNATFDRISQAASSDSRRSRSRNGIAATSLHEHGGDGLKFSVPVHSFESNFHLCPKDQSCRHQSLYYRIILLCLSSKDGAEKSATLRSPTPPPASPTIRCSIPRSTIGWDFRLQSATTKSPPFLCHITTSTCP